MPHGIEMKEIIGRLSAAQSAGLIVGWKVLGPVILIRQQNRNFYVPSASAKSFLQELTADC